MSNTIETHGPRQATLDLIQNYDNFHAEMIEELSRQSSRSNSSSERRMRKLLRDFKEKIYVPYRNASLGRE